MSELHVNKRLKLEKYHQQISGENWLIAIIGYSERTNTNIAITTDRVRASECKGTTMDYAKLFKTAPELLEVAEKIIEKKSVITKNKFQYATIPIGFLIKLEKTIAKAKGEEG